MSITKGYYSLRYKFSFNNIRKYKSIKYLDCYDNFTNLIVKNNKTQLPKKIKRLHFGYSFN